MYFWKCWRNTRARFGFSLILVAMLCVLIIVIVSKMGGPASFQKGGPLTSVPNMWANVGRAQLGGLVSLAILWGALTLGVVVMGEEFREQTLGFLFTRPRPRRYWVWTSWLTGVGELFAVTFLAVMGIFGGLIYLSGSVYTWRLLAAVVPLWIGAIVVYTLAYFLTVVARSSEKGVSYSLGILLIDLLLPLAGYYWHFQVSSVLDLMHDGCGWAVGPASAFPWRLFIICAALSGALLLGAQVLTERRDE